MKRVVLKVLLALILWIVILSVKYMILTVDYVGVSPWTQIPHSQIATKRYPFLTADSQMPLVKHPSLSGALGIGTSQRNQQTNPEAASNTKAHPRLPNKSLKLTTQRNPPLTQENDQLLIISQKQRLVTLRVSNITTQEIRQFTKQPSSASRLEKTVQGSASVQSHTAEKLGTTRTMNTKDYNPPWNCSGCFQWNYQLILNEKDLCKTHDNQKIDQIFLIPSTHAKTAERNAIRETWASITRNNTSNFRHVFFFGVTKDQARMRLVEEESRHFRDVVLMRFDDTYRNLTVKTLTMLRWLTETCAKARFFLKADDDMWVNTRTLMDKLNPVETELQTATSGTCAMSPQIIRNTRNKWSATYKEYPADEYPRYCSGTAYAGTVNVAKQLVNVSKDIPFFHLEDVFVGLCLKQLGYQVKSLGGFHMLTPRFVRGDVCEVWRAKVATIHVVPPKVLRQYWSAPCGNLTDLLPSVVD
ncbi:beta-1,3-galactosyltransferase 5-like [Littorina saxatilis]|uniref:beta-1,3-galactosyltransferase 5-like n=1 Tax=Littorina saxatilis TaxID=31220 RepID=UPI0038B56692